MVNARVEDASRSRFLDEALRIGRSLAGGAVEHDGRATWLTDAYAFIDGRWQPTVATLEADLGAGTAGVGWVLARLAAAAGGDRTLARRASMAVRHSLVRVPALLGAGRLDWYHGASGLAWAAIDAGRAVDDGELVAVGTSAARASVDAAAARVDEPRDWSLVGGECGVVAGLLALAPFVDGDRAVEVAAHVSRAVAGAVPDRARSLDVATSGVVPAGLARGLSGVGLVLSAAADIDGDVAYPAFGAPSPRSAPCWSPASAGSPTMPTRGGPRVGPRRHHGAAAQRASASLGSRPSRTMATSPCSAKRRRRSSWSAAIWRRFRTRTRSVCHGTAGVVELLLLAGTFLDEPAHTAAARRVGAAMVAASRSGRRYGSGVAVGAHNPSLLFGLAGTAAVLARLHDPDSMTSPALPPILPIRRHPQPGEEPVAGTGGT